MKGKLFLVGLLLLVCTLAFAQNQEFERLLGEFEGLAKEYEKFANEVTRNPNGDYTNRINNLQRRANNLQSRYNSWLTAMANSPSAPVPTDSQNRRLLNAMDRIQKAGTKIAYAYL